MPEYRAEFIQLVRIQQHLANQVRIQSHDLSSLNQLRSTDSLSGMISVNRRILQLLNSRDRLADSSLAILTRIRAIGRTQRANLVNRERKFLDSVQALVNFWTLLQAERPKFVEYDTVLKAVLASTGSSGGTPNRSGLMNISSSLDSLRTRIWAGSFALSAVDTFFHKERHYCSKCAGYH